MQPEKNNLVADHREMMTASVTLAVTRPAYMGAAANTTLPVDSGISHSGSPDSGKSEMTGVVTHSEKIVAGASRASRRSIEGKGLRRDAAVTISTVLHKSVMIWKNSLSNW